MGIAHCGSAKADVSHRIAGKGEDADQLTFQFHPDPIALEEPPAGRRQMHARGGLSWRMRLNEWLQVDQWDDIHEACWFRNHVLADSSPFFRHSLDSSVCGRMYMFIPRTSYNRLWIWLWRPPQQSRRGGSGYHGQEVIETLVEERAHGQRRGCWRIVDV